MKKERSIGAQGIEEILVAHEERLDQLEKGRKAITERVAALPLTARTEHTMKLEDETKEKLSAVADELERIRKMLDVHPRSWRETLWMKFSRGVSLTLLATLAISAALYFNSATYWGKRYYKVCHHPKQQNEVILSHKGDAYEFTMEMFEHSKESKRRFKSHIREQEQTLRVRE